MRCPDEQAIIDCFASFLHRKTGLTWTASKDEVANRNNGRNYDCEFTSGIHRPVAADIFRLYPFGSEQEVQGARHRIIDKLTRELHGLGLGGLYFTTPIPQKKHVDPKWFKRIASEFRAAVSRDPQAETYQVEDICARRCGPADDPIFFGHHWVSNHQPIEAAVYPLLAELKRKHDQVAVEGHDKYLIGTLRGMPVSLDDIVAACAFIDFTPFPTIDRIYFQISREDFRMVYDAEARQAMERGLLPSNGEQRRLVVSWIEVLMGFHWAKGLDIALKISWDEGGTGWLSASGREVLEMESHLLLQNCGWNTPRAYWEIHRGRVPLIGDGRRRLAPIRAA